MVVGGSVVAVAGPDFSSAWTLRFIVGGVCAADCGVVAGTAGGGAGGCRLRSILQAATPGQAFLLGYASGILWYAGTCYWIYDTMHEHGGLSVPAAALALFLFCLYLGLYHGLFGLLVGLAAGPGRDNRLALVSVPFLWVAVELARTRVTGFPWDLLGTAQVDNISLSRITTWTGVYGVSFEIMLVNVAVAAAFLVPRKKRNTLLLAALAAAAVLQAGRLVDAPALAGDHAALLVQENIPVDENWTRDTFERTLRELTDLSVKAEASSSSSSRATNRAHGKVDLIVWPESPAPFFAIDPLFRGPVSEMARATHSWVVTGAIGSTPASRWSAASEVFNSAALVSPRVSGLHAMTKCIWSRLENTCRSRSFCLCRRADERGRRVQGGRIASAAGCGKHADGSFYLLRVGIPGRGAAICK